MTKMKRMLVAVGWMIANPLNSLLKLLLSTIVAIAWKLLYNLQIGNIKHKEVRTSAMPPNTSKPPHLPPTLHDMYPNLPHLYQ